MDTAEAILGLLFFAGLFFALWFVTDVLFRDNYAPPESASWYLRPLALHLRALLGIRERADRSDLDE